MARVATYLGILLALFVLSASAERGVPLGPCTDGVATHYNDAYIYNPNQGGTCGLEPPKYANYGRLSACSTGAGSIYNPISPVKSDGCGVCYEVYGLNGAVLVIIGDHGSAEGTDFNLIENDGHGAFADIIGSGLGSHQMAYRQVSCPTSDGGEEWVQGNIKVSWQQEGANNFYFELHFWNYRVGIKSVTLTSSEHTTPVELQRKEVSNMFVYEDNGNVGVPFTLEITSFLDETLTHTVGTAGQDIATIAYGGGNEPIEFSFGSQFTTTANPNDDDPDCTPPADPAIIYDDELFSEKAPPHYGWRQVTQYTMNSPPNYDYSTDCADGNNCIRAVFGQFGGFIIGVYKFMKADFTGIRFKVKGDAVFNGLALSWEGQSDSFRFNVTTSWVTHTMNFADYPSIPTLIDPGHFRFTSNAVSPAIYFDSIEMVGGDGRANYVPGARIFPDTNSDGGDGGDGDGAASTLSSVLSEIL